jgi:hypothetical protein
MKTQGAFMPGLSIIFFLPAALGATVVLEEGDSIQTAMNDASPGDIIVLSEGTYSEDLSTEVAGSEDAPITLTAEYDASVTITAPGEVLQVDHPFWKFENIVFDGQFGGSDTIDINDDAHHTELVGVTVQNSGRDCIDMGSPADVSITESTIHSCLWFDADEEERRDAHGITGGAVQNLSIIDTVIHTFSGDAIQFDPGREAPGWNNILIQGCSLYLEPLEEAVNGFEAGQTTGENAIDTKTWAEAERASLIIEDTKVWGFQNGLDIDNQAAFLIKEGVDATFRRVLVRDSEIGFRVSGPTTSRPKGAHVRIENSVLYDLDVGVRFENNIENLAIFHTTFGMGIHTPLVEVDSEAPAPAIKNSLFAISELPSLATEANGNRASSVDDFVNATARNHRLNGDSEAIDVGVAIDDIDTDYDRNDRWFGDAPDAGAFEYNEEEGPDDTGEMPDTGFNDTASPTDTGPIDSTEPETPEESEPGVPGIGAAEQVGEKGGCGCANGSAPDSGLAWIYASLFAAFRRKRMN